ncbi:MAG: beta-propeller domain-containing protein [Deltaproteobacteria bacterium]|nr:beta-propeller domain-containing protein [Deltaproteobacteria bacterium]
MTKSRLGMLAAWLVLAAVACDQAPATIPASPISAALHEARSCEEVRTGYVDALVAAMRARLAATRDDMISRLGTDCWAGADAGGDTGDDADADSDSDGDSDNSADGASDYSTTNTQEMDVDEPDFIKNDGTYIYVLADGAFQILKAWPAAETTRLSATPIEGTPKRMFVANGRAVIYSALEQIGAGDPAFEDAFYASEYGTECTYAYDCDMVGDGRALEMTVLDLSDPAAPAVARETVFEGAFLSARAIDGIVHTVVVHPQPQTPQLPDVPPLLEEYQWSCDGIPFPESVIDALFEDLADENEEILRATPLGDVIPEVDDRLADGAPLADPFAACSGVYLSDNPDGAYLVSVLSFNPAADDPLVATSALGRPGAIYASKDNLYLAARHGPGAFGDGYWPDGSGIEEATTVHEFRLQGAKSAAAYLGSGVVEGHVLNQFSMSEWKGSLRIATSSGHVPDPDVHSAVTILRPDNGALVTVGKVDGIAPSEDIRSVRFREGRGYVVTFKKTDPLFVLDLADPENPEILGELKIPGFSTYMHFLDAGHLLTIGFDADDMGDFAWFDGMQLQIIDVTDPAAPTLLHKELIGTRGSTSEAATNHLAFNYFASRRLLALPLTVCEGGGDGSYGYDMTFSGLRVYKVTIEDGFTLLGGIPHAAPTSGGDYYETCGSWWASPTTAVKRSVFMEDFVYSVAPELVNVAAVSDLSNVIASVDLAVGR